MALIPKEGSRKRFDPPAVRYAQITPDERDAKGDLVREGQLLRLTCFYSVVYFSTDTGREETGFSHFWTDAQIEGGYHLLITDKEDCPGREEEWERARRWYDNLSFDEALAWNRSLSQGNGCPPKGW